MSIFDVEWDIEDCDEIVKEIGNKILQMPLNSESTIGRILNSIDADKSVKKMDLIGIACDVDCFVESKGYYLDRTKYWRMVVGTLDNLTFVLKKLNPSEEITKEDLMHASHISFEESGNGPFYQFPCFRFAFKDGKYYWQSNVKGEKEISQEEAEKFIDKIYDLGLTTWKENYSPEEGIVVMDGTQWKLIISLPDGRAYVKEGDNEFPETYDALIEEIKKMK